MLLLKFFHATLKSESCEQQVHAKSQDPCFVKKRETAISVQLLVATFFRELIGEQNCMVTLQYNAMSQTANCSMTTHKDVLCKWMLAVL
jgi:hypothetical protein